MAANRVNGSGNGARSGAQTLVLLAAPFNSPILKSLSTGAKQQAELRRDVGFPAQTTLRAQLKRLVENGVIDKRRRNRFPGVLEYELTKAGRDLLSVLAVLEGWLATAPDGPLVLSDSAARAAIKALGEGWSTTMLRALAAGPLSLTELDGVIVGISYPALERRLAAMRLAGLIAPSPGNSRGTPYAVTEWLRRGLAPLAVAARWERLHAPRATTPIGRLDVEAVFLLTVPQLRLPEKLRGRCSLAVEIAHEAGPRQVGVTAEIREGGVTSCATKLRNDADAWAFGSPLAWLNAVIEGNSGGLEVGGDSALTAATIGGLHEMLFGVAARK